MQVKVFPIILICFFFCFISCQKEPRKGEYKGTFTGKYTTDTISVVYKTIYYFDVTRSTNKKLYLQEKQSRVTSILVKHEKDSISGMLGFGSVFNPNESSDIKFNTINVYGKYDDKSITGKFSFTISEGNKEYLSQGDFNLVRY
jgi:hypothetical protein